MPQGNRIKEQLMVLIDPDVMVRMDALRIVMGVSRAEVNRLALNGRTLETLETENVERLTRLVKLAAGAGLTQDDFVRVVVKGRKTMPTLEELEALSKDELRSLAGVAA